MLFLTCGIRNSAQNSFILKAESHAKLIQNHICAISLRNLAFLQQELLFGFRERRQELWLPQPQGHVGILIMQRLSKHHLLVLFGDAPETERRRVVELLRTRIEDADLANAYQLVDRNRITLSADKILKEASRDTLRPFRFLIGKN
jgi:hypothetical protein